jgi:hypothetical protein
MAHPVVSNPRFHVIARAARTNLHSFLLPFACCEKAEVIHLLRATLHVAMNRCIAEVSMNAGHMPLQVIRVLVFHKNKRALKEYEAHIQSRLQHIQCYREELKERSQAWDTMQADNITGISC